MNNEYENEGISFLDLCKVAFGRKILLLIITLSITLIGCLFVKFSYNKNKTKVSAEYNYSITGLDNGEYFDGSAFNYRNLVSLNNLNIVKDSDPSFSNINTEKLHENDAIMISKTVTGEEDSKDVTYKITVYLKYFSSSSQAMKFMNKLADLPYNRTISLLDTVKYDSYLIGAKTSTDYESQIAFLEMQEELLQTNYEEIIEKYSDRTLSDGKKVSDYYNSLLMYVQSKKINNLLALIEEKGYVKNYSKVETELINEKKALESEKNLNNSKIAALADIINELMINANAQGITNFNTSFYDETISELTIRNVEIDNELAIIDNKIAHKDQPTTEFDALINGYQAELESYTNDFVKAQKEVINNEAAVNVLNNKPIVQGRIKPIIGIAIFLVGGLIVGACVNLIIDRKKLFADNANVEE